MTRPAKTILTYAAIILTTLLAVEGVSFAILVWQSARSGDLGLGEAVSRRIHQHPLLDRLAVGRKGESEYVFSPPTQYTLRPDATFSGLKIGRHGFILNGDREPAHFPEKPPGLVRIVMLGGSSVAGATASGNDKTIPARLEALLNKDGEGPFQVLNFGMGGNYSYGEVMKLIAEAIYLRPDAVIMLDGFNDAHYANFEHLRANLDAPLINWADFSYHYFDAMTVLRGNIRPPPPVMTYAYLLVQSIQGKTRPGTMREHRAAVYDGLAVRALSDWVAETDPLYLSVLKTNMDVAAAWAARNGVWFFGYLQPHPWEFKDTACERDAGIRMIIPKLGPAMDMERYAEIMRSAFQGYARVYGELDAAYDDAPRVRFMDMRRLFDGVTDCIYMDAIHYNDAGNAIIAGRMVEDLEAAGVAPPSP